jgi:hypothetical protein
VTAIEEADIARHAQQLSYMRGEVVSVSQFVREAVASAGAVVERAYQSATSTKESK